MFLLLTALLDMLSSLEFVTKENVKLVFPPADDFFNFCGPFVHRIIASSAPPPNDYFCPLRSALASVANVNTIAFLSKNFRQKITLKQNALPKRQNLKVVNQLPFWLF